MKGEETIINLFGTMPYKPLVQEIKDYAIFHLNTDGFILSWNQGARLIFGYSKDEIIGQDFTTLFTPEDRADGVPELELSKAAETGRAEDTRWHLRKDGSRFFAQGVTTALRDEDGKLLGYAKIARDDTARRQMEEALLESEERYRIVAETASDAIISINRESTILFINRAAERIFGYEVEQMIGQPLTMLMPEYLRHAHNAGLTRYLETGKRHLTWEHVEVPGLHKDGHEFPLELSFGEFNKNNKHIFIGIARDVSSRKRAEEIIRHTQARLESVLAAGLAGTFYWDIPNNRVVTDENLMRCFSLSEKALTEGVPLEEVLPAICEEDRPKVAEALTEAIERKGVYQVEYRITSPDEKVSWLSARGTVERDENGNARELTGFAVDITRIKEAEEALRESEQQLRTLADTIPQLAWMAEPDGFIFWYNRRWYEYTGTTPEQMAGWGWQSVHDPQMLAEVIERWKHSIETGKEFEMEFPLRSGNGDFRWFLTRITPLRDSQENLTRWFGTNTDIHENRIAQQNAEFLDSVSEDLVRLKSIDEVIQTIGAKIGKYLNLSLCSFVEINDSADTAAVTHDWHREDARGIIGVYPLRDFLTEDFQRAGRAGEVFVVRDVFADERTDGESYARLNIVSFVCVPLIRQGQWRYLLAIHDSKPRDWREDEIGLIRELTARVWTRLERARAEEERERLLLNEQAAREEAERANRLKDEFLATLSHELRTPLNAILGWSQMLQNKNLDESAAKLALETIERNARAQNQLIDDILDVSRIITGKLRLDVRAVDLPGVIMAAADAARPAAEAKNIRLQTLLDPRAGQISGDPDRLQQVVWNLLSNAVKFTPKGGRVQVRLERVNSHVEIVVSDTGAGIKPEFLPFVFERFRQSDGSTTRRHGGLGLGLAIVRQLVELHGGSVSVSSDGQEQGATFTVSLPLLPFRVEAASEVPREHPAAQDKSVTHCPPELSGLRVLLVDDEKDSRDLLNVVLESCAAQVMIASSAAEALELVRRERFDVIVSDIGMPDEDGYSLIRKIREFTDEQGGNVPAIALTAYARAEDRVQALRSGFQMHIAKPVEPAELIVAIANLAGRMRKQNVNENIN